MTITIEAERLTAHQARPQITLDCVYAKTIEWRERPAVELKVKPSTADFLPPKEWMEYMKIVAPQNGDMTFLFILFLEAFTLEFKE